MTLFRIVSCLTLFALAATVAALPRDNAKAQVVPAVEPPAIASHTDRGNATTAVATAQQSDTPPNATKLKVLGIFSKEAMERRNPLWEVPLASVTATRERPIFSPTRRPPPTRVAAAVQPLPRLKQPDRLTLTLVGVIIGEKAGVAIFRDESTKNIVRLRLGDSHSGWLLERVTGREATLRRNGEVATVALPAPITQ